MKLEIDPAKTSSAKNFCGLVVLLVLDVEVVVVVGALVVDGDCLDRDDAVIDAQTIEEPALLLLRGMCFELDAAALLDEDGVQMDRRADLVEDGQRAEVCGLQHQG